MARKQIVLRVDPSVNSAVRKAARKAGVSINQFCEERLARASGAKVRK